MLLDESSEPRIFKHVSSSGREGLRMSENEMRAFGISCLTTVYREQGMDVSVPKFADQGTSPDLVLKSRNGKIYFVLVNAFAFPATFGNLGGSDLSIYRATAERAGALPTIASVGLYCFDTDGLKPVCGGSFALKFNSLEAIS